MKYITTTILGVFLLVILFLTISTQRQLLKNETDTNLSVLNSNTTVAPKATIEEEILKSLTPEEKVGQLFMFGFEGTSLSSQNKQFLKEKHIGGVLLLGKNISSEEQLKLLIEDLQSTNHIPLFIAIDQEGGIVSRLKWNKVLTTSQSEVLSYDQAYELAKNRGGLLRSYGINMNLAPVVEYITEKNSFMYNRVYRGSKEDVIQKSIGSVNGYSDSDILSVIKHFPGHSNSSPDSHYNLPIVEISEKEWSEYISPFSSVIKGTDVDALMVGHIKFPNIDKKPTTLSKEIITTRLIEELNYQGLVISDDMEMDALNGISSHTEIAKQAILAGNDILIYSMYSNKYPTIQKDVYEYILNEVKSGNINIDEKVLKILRAKIKYSILEPTNYLNN